MKYNIIILFLVSTFSFVANAQRNMGDSSIATPLLGFQYGLSWSAGDLAQRYGMFNNVGIAAGYKFAKNWYAGFEGDFMFGRDIKINGADLFGDLVDSKGTITDINGDIATVLLFSRGFHANVEIGRVFNKLGHNANSGVFIKAGAGYLNHRIRIETNYNVVPGIELDYKKGYDRLTTGINLNQFVGYLFMSDNSFLNFYAGFFIQEGFTHNRRTVFFDQPNTPVPTETRTDILYGGKIGWLIPIYKRKPKDFYYN